MRVVRFLVLALALSAWFGCEDSGGSGSSEPSAPDAMVQPSAPDGLSVGARCFASETLRCATGLTCLASFRIANDRFSVSICSKPCASNVECEAGAVCGFTQDGTRGCVPPPDQAGYVEDAQGMAVACPLAPATFCEECGCADPATRCEPGVGCVAKGKLFDKCSADSDCESNNCGKTSRVCNVAVGEACSSRNCDECVSYTASGFAGTSYCSRECSDHSTCGDLRCVGGYCRRQCRFSQDECPGTCKFVSTDSSSAAGFYYCACVEPDCTFSRP